MKRNDRIFEKVVIAMEKESLFLDKNLTLEKLCLEAAVNRTYLLEAFRQNGTNFVRMVNAYRTRYAIDLLLRSDQQSMSIGDIAECSGFATVRKMNRYIKRSTGQTAGAYREWVFGKS